MKEKLISVIIPTYRDFSNIELNLKSIFEQDYGKLEIIISDDGSPNFSDMFYDAYKNRPDNISRFVVLKREMNVGTVQNLTEAFENANGEYIIVLSQDDRFQNPHAISLIAEKFEKEGADFVTYKRIGRISNTIYPSSNELKIFEANRKTIIKRTLLSNFISGSSISYRKTSWESIGKFDADFRLVEDYPFVIKAFENKYSFLMIDEVLINYGEHGVSSRKKKQSNVLLKDYSLVIKKYVLPNLNIYRHHISKRYIRRKYEMLVKNNGISHIIINIKYIDILIFKIYSNMVSKNILDIFMDMEREKI
ncbi:MAG: glycosyltransferase [Clostridia bacterium]|nr:glycosyltransferase [Clostridia bacterium]